MSIALNLPRIVAVTSGNGGAGKTFFAANLAATLAATGSRVLFVDTDLGLVNLDIALGRSRPHTLRDVAAGRAPLAQALQRMPGGFDGLLVGAGVVEASCVTPGVGDPLADALAALRGRYDWIVLDTGAGISDVVLRATAAAPELIVVVSTEPTALTDAYATIKGLVAEQGRRHLRLVINQTHRDGEAKVIHGQLQLVVNHFVKPPLTLELLGEVPLDPLARNTARHHELLAVVRPDAPAALAIAAVATRLTATGHTPV